MGDEEPEAEAQEQYEADHQYLVVAAAADGAEHRAPADRKASLAAAAGFVEADGGEGAEEGEAGHRHGKPLRLAQFENGKGERQAGGDIDGCEEDAVGGHAAEILPAGGQSCTEIGELQIGGDRDRRELDLFCGVHAHKVRQFGGMCNHPAVMRAF